MDLHRDQMIPLVQSGRWRLVRGFGPCGHWESAACAQPHPQFRLPNERTLARRVVGQKLSAVPQALCKRVFVKGDELRVRFKAIGMDYPYLAAREHKNEDARRVCIKQTEQHRPVLSTHKVGSGKGPWLNYSASFVFCSLSLPSLSVTRTDSVAFLRNLLPFCYQGGVKRDEN